MVCIFMSTALQVTIMDQNAGFVPRGRRKLEVSSRTCRAEPGTTPPAKRCAIFVLFFQILFQPVINAGFFYGQKRCKAVNIYK
jgi:hypothetical protein